MGPRSYDRGEMAARSSFTRPVPLQWGRGLTTAERGFSARSRSARAILQWGRGLTTAERETTPDVDKIKARALQWGRGLTTAESRRDSIPRRPAGRPFNGAAVLRPRRDFSNVSPALAIAPFNGAAVLRPRRAIPAGAVGAGGPPSMGPRSYDRGEHSRCALPSHPGGPSMGPRSYDRGEHPIIPRPLLVVDPSMGPRSYDRGEPARFWRP